MTDATTPEQSPADATDAATVESSTPAAPTGAVSQITAEKFDAMAAFGGVRGLLESIVPGLVFVVVFVIWRDLTPALIASAGIAVIAFLTRLVARDSLTTALGGLFGVLVGVVWAWRTGEASDFFVWGFVTNAVYLVGLLVSVLVRWPAVGAIVALLKGEWEGWRSSPAFPRYMLATWLWIGLFAARLAVQLPLYWADSVAWLGTARLAMGVPLFALVLWLTWLLVREPESPGSGESAPRP